MGRVRRFTQKGDYVVQTVADLAQLSEDDLALCLGALRATIRERRRLHREAVKRGDVAPDAPVPFERFVWSPRQAAKAGSADVHPEMSIDELPLSWRSRSELKRRKVLCLEDFTAMTEGELKSIKYVGPMAVERVRSMLKPLCLDFAPPADEPALAEASRRMMSRRLRLLPAEQRESELSGLPDSADVGKLGLPISALTQCERLGFTTVGSLRAAKLFDLRIALGTVALRDVYQALTASGQAWTPMPSQHELWRAGVLGLEQLSRPDADSTPTEELTPWIGRAATNALTAAGVSTLGDLRARSRSKELPKVRGLGPSALERIHAFLGVASPTHEGRIPSVADVWGGRGSPLGLPAD